MVSSRLVLLSFEEKHVRKRSVCSKSYIESIYSIFGKLQKHMFTKKPAYSVKIVRYALLLRYKSIQSYRMLLEHSQLPTFLLFHKLSSCTIDAVKCTQKLRNKDKLSNDVCLMIEKIFF